LTLAWRLALCVLVAAPYLRGVLTNGFVWLDHGEIVEGHLIITQLSQLPALFTNDLNFAGYHRPLYTLAHSLDRALFGLEPAGFLATSLLLHVLAAYLLMRLLEELGLPTGAAFGGALLFGLHPLNTVVAGLIHSKADSLVLVFGLAATRSVVVGARDAQQLRPWAWALVYFALALLSKETAAILPLIWITLAWTFRGELAAAALPRARIFAVLCSLLVGGLAWSRLAQPAVTYESPVGLFTRLTTFGAVYVDYARQLLLPLERKVADTVTLLAARPLDQKLMLVVMLTALVVLQVQLAQRSRRMRAWLIALNLSLLPVAQLVPILHFRADRFLYPASACLCGMLAQAAVQLWGGRPAGRAPLAGALLLATMALSLGWVVERRTREFVDDPALFGPELLRRPDYREGAAVLAQYHDAQGDPERAAGYWQRALATRPQALSYVDFDGLVLGASRNQLTRGLPGEAYDLLVGALPSMQRPGHRAHARYNLGIAAFRIGRYEEALSALDLYRAALPEDPDGHFIAGQAAEKLERFDLALDAYAAYLALDVTPENRAAIEERVRAIRALD